ncbi:hypothetical protein TNCT_350331 [Trichonephila clavata]|uniref:Uncharacterized protein n=1 Tax=Trichonephila clavata TaxID=2740835 RepID=A0A8X6GAC6_TRICU|nr:hypothetical protein TNCT_350331 [Trichonephila clavata]
MLKEELIRPGIFHDPDLEAVFFNEPTHRLNKAKLSDLVRDHDLPKQKAGSLASRLQWNLLLSLQEYRTREKNFHFFEKKEHLIACIDANDLMNFMNISYDLNN